MFSAAAKSWRAVRGPAGAGAAEVTGDAPWAAVVVGAACAVTGAPVVGAVVNDVEVVTDGAAR